MSLLAMFSEHRLVMDGHVQDRSIYCASTVSRGKLVLSTNTINEHNQYYTV